MQVGRFIKRLINPEPEEQGESKRDEREVGSGAEEESRTDLTQGGGYSDSQLGEPVSANTEVDSSPEPSPVDPSPAGSPHEGEAGSEPDPEPEPEPKPEEELRTASSLYATDSELREAGLDPD